MTLRRCLYCLRDLVLASFAAGVSVCSTCGLQYTAELLESTSDERWEEVLTSSTFEIHRTSGNPPSVVITELAR